MARNPLFSTYRQGENRVTSSMLAVFERIDLILLEAILTAASGESSLQMVTFTNQPQGEGHSTPDARIAAHFAYWFEIKTTRGTLRSSQLTEHLRSLDGPRARLFVVTPDAEQPAVITTLGDPRVVWFSFRSLSDAIDLNTSGPAGQVSDQARLLLAEFQALLDEEGLTSHDDVVIVAARFAYPEYHTLAAYVCQPGRAFRDGLTHLGFYANGAIQPFVPRIQHRRDLVPFTHDHAAVLAARSPADQRVGAVIMAHLRDGTREVGQQYQVFLLSDPGGEDTVRLAHRIDNDARSGNGRSRAWTMGQRYVALSDLTAPGVRVTSDLGS